MKRLLKVSAFLFMLNMPMAFAKSSLEITNAIVRMPVVPSVTVTAAFMTIKNNSDKDLKLIGAKGEMAGYFELHTMDMKDGKMKMRTVDSIILKAKSTTKLESGGLHLMIFDLKKPLEEKKTYTINLIFDDKSEKKIDVVVQKISVDM